MGSFSCAVQYSAHIPRTARSVELREVVYTFYRGFVGCHCARFTKNLDVIRMESHPREVCNLYRDGTMLGMRTIVKEGMLAAVATAWATNIT